MTCADAKRVTLSTGPRPDAKRSSLAATAAFLLMTGCGAMTANGTDAGCASYGEARLAQPRHAPLPEGPWGDWIADTDDRLTGVCR